MKNFFVAASQQPIFDLFGSDIQDSSASNSNAAGLNSQSSSQKASDDLLQLAANPFASPTGASPAIPPLPNNSWSTASTTQNGVSSFYRELYLSYRLVNSPIDHYSELQ